MPRPISAAVNLSALRSNLLLARVRAGGAQVLAVVKADAYGHGLLRVLPAIGDADGLALVELEGAVRLREHRYQRRILLLGGFHSVGDLDEIAARRLSIAVHCDEQLRMLEKVRLSRPLEVFVKVNSGMNRLGFAVDRVAGVCERLGASANVAALRLMTHLARADEPDGIAEQKARFDEACRDLAFPRTLANSAGVFRYAEVGGQLVRPGVMLYGASPFAGETAESLGLTPVMTLSSQVIAVQQLAAGERIGYGGAWQADAPRRIGVVACGYGDGYPRSAPSGTPVVVAGVRTRTVGRVSMDLLTVDLEPVPEAGVGSPVVLWGEGVPVDEVAAHAGTIGYELLTRLSARVPVETVRVERVDIEV
jgi:alanine racemase